jgi:hypothetical protein
VTNCTYCTDHPDHPTAILTRRRLQDEWVTATVANPNDLATRVGKSLATFTPQQTSLTLLGELRNN